MKFDALGWCFYCIFILCLLFVLPETCHEGATKRVRFMCIVHWYVVYVTICSSVTVQPDGVIIDVLL